MNSFEMTLDRLKQTGSVDLMELRQLKLEELEKLETEIMRWCLYGGGKLERFGRGNVIN